jgi:hypothetical protein
MTLIGLALMMFLNVHKTGEVHRPEIARSSGLTLAK